MAEFQTKQNILSGGNIVTNSITSTVLITVPAGRVWKGTISVVGLSAATTASMQNARVVTVGTNVLPPANTILAIAASQMQSSGPSEMQVTDVYVSAPAGNAVTINLINSTATTFTGTAACNGVLL